MQQFLSEKQLLLEYQDIVARRDYGDLQTAKKLDTVSLLHKYMP